MSISWPETDVGLALHDRLGTNDPLAASDFTAAFLDPLVACLARNHPEADEHTRLTAAEDAILSVIRNPAVYNPDLRTLPGFLQMAAEADLANMAAGERRHHRGRKHPDLVELPDDDGNGSREARDPELPSWEDPDIAAVIAAFAEIEQRVFDLMRAGERRTAAFAEVLDITHLAADEQAREVRRVKERLFKRLRRTREQS